MRFYDPKPREYVDTFVANEMPWEMMLAAGKTMQDTVDKARVEAQKGDDFLSSLQGGLKTEAETERLKKDFAPRIEALKNNINTYKNLGSVSGEVAKLLSDIKNDSRYQDIKADYEYKPEALKILSQVSQNDPASLAWAEENAYDPINRKFTQKDLTGQRVSSFNPSWYGVLGKPNPYTENEKWFNEIMPNVRTLVESDREITALATRNGMTPAEYIKTNSAKVKEIERKKVEEFVRAHHGKSMYEKRATTESPFTQWWLNKNKNTYGTKADEDEYIREIVDSFPGIFSEIEIKDLEGKATTGGGKTDGNKTTKTPASTVQAPVEVSGNRIYKPSALEGNDRIVDTEDEYNQVDNFYRKDFDTHWNNKVQEANKGISNLGISMSISPDIDHTDFLQKIELSPEEQAKYDKLDITSQKQIDQALASANSEFKVSQFQKQAFIAGDNLDAENNNLVPGLPIEEQPVIKNNPDIAKKLLTEDIKLVDKAIKQGFLQEKGSFERSVGIKGQLIPTHNDGTINYTEAKNIVYNMKASAENLSSNGNSDNPIEIRKKALNDLTSSAEKAKDKIYKSNKDIKNYLNDRTNRMTAISHALEPVMPFDNAAQVKRITSTIGQSINNLSVNTIGKYINEAGNDETVRIRATNSEEGVTPEQLKDVQKYLNGINNKTDEEINKSSLANINLRLSKKDGEYVVGVLVPTKNKSGEDVLKMFDVIGINGLSDIASQIDSGHNGEFQEKSGQFLSTLKATDGKVGTAPYLETDFNGIVTKDTPEYNKTINQLNAILVKPLTSDVKLSNGVVAKQNELVFKVKDPVSGKDNVFKAANTLDMYNFFAYYSQMLALQNTGNTKEAVERYKNALDSGVDILGDNPKLINYLGLNSTYKPVKDVGGKK